MREKANAEGMSIEIALHALQADARSHPIRELKIAMRLFEMCGI